jgi:hypothetical protein
MQGDTEYRKKKVTVKAGVHDDGRNRQKHALCANAWPVQWHTNTVSGE